VVAIATVLTGLTFEQRVIAIGFSTEKLEWYGYPTVKKVSENMFTRIDTMHKCDRHPYRQTPHNGIGLGRAYG